MTVRFSRRDDWERRLALLLDAAHGVRFRWGRHDCVVLGLAAVEAETDRNLLSLLPRWSSRREATVILAEGLPGFARRCADLFGYAWVAPAHLLRGDIGLLEDETLPFGGALGVVDLSGRHARFAARRGLAARPVAALAGGWRVI